jgi:hypothetical protein
VSKNYTTFDHLAVNVEEITKIPNLILAEHPNLRQMHQFEAAKSNTSTSQIQTVCTKWYKFITKPHLKLLEVVSDPCTKCPVGIGTSCAACQYSSGFSSTRSRSATLPKNNFTIAVLISTTLRCVNPHRPIFPKSHSVKSLRCCELHKSLTSHQVKKRTIIAPSSELIGGFCEKLGFVIGEVKISGEFNLQNVINSR